MRIEINGSKFRFVDLKPEDVITEIPAATDQDVAKVRATARKTGYTASLVMRNNERIITVAPRVGDITICRINGRNGMYTGHETDW